MFYDQAADEKSEEEAVTNQLMELLEKRTGKRKCKTSVTVGGRNGEAETSNYSLSILS